MSCHTDVLDSTATKAPGLEVSGGPSISLKLYMVLIAFDCGGKALCISPGY